MQNNEQIPTNEVNLTKSDKRTRLAQKVVLGGLAAGLAAASFAAVNGLGGSDEKTPAGTSTTEVPTTDTSASVNISENPTLITPENSGTSQPEAKVSENPVLITPEDTSTIN
ncbi:hypothetical protein H0X10_00970 [Candidatus Saccharibacteria bacterium]|nr:hypothetical protein [Candidatus Saccharibacteria bacterium]